MVYIILFLIFLLALIILSFLDSKHKKKDTITLGAIFSAILLFLRLGPAKVLNFVIMFLPLIHYFICGVKYRRKNFSAADEKSMTKERACEILQVDANATKQEIRAAYKKLILKNHPDHGGSRFIAEQIIKAKQVLLNEE